MPRKKTATKPKRAKPDAVETPTRPPREPIPLPEWWQPPTVQIDTRSLFGAHRHCAQHSSVSAWQVLSELREGRLALPPWQRDDVWTREQRLYMLDSIMRGLPLGPVIVWRPESARSWREIEGCPLLPIAGYEPREKRVSIVIDGRQRLTTLAMAARGNLGIRWNGEHWTEGPGCVDAVQLFAGLSDPMWISLHDNGVDEATVRTLCYWMERAHYHKFSFLLLDDYTLDEVVEVYRRLATCGTPHSRADLAAMESWLAERRKFAT